MSEFPELQGYEVHSSSTGDISEKDLASRERELLGEDGAAALVGNGSRSAADYSETEQETYGDAAVGESTAASSASSLSKGTLGTGAGPSAYKPQKVNLSESEFLKDWKTKKEQEIAQRDSVSNEKRDKTKEKARKAIDDFYDNYNSKKEKDSIKVRDAAEEFTKKRDAENGSGKGTLWDRVADLMDGLGRPAEGVEPSDKKRFVELVQSLKGDAKAPGAAGY